MPPSGMPWPRTEWDEIIPGLFMGGHIWATNYNLHQRFRTNLRGVTLFDRVVSLHHDPAYAQTVPDEHIQHDRFEILDGAVEDEWRDELDVLAISIAKDIEEGKKVLVRCYAGYNRSGLVVAQTMMRLGWNAEDAIAQIRRQRSAHALHNRAFVAHLKGLDLIG